MNRSGLWKKYIYTIKKSWEICITRLNLPLSFFVILDGGKHELSIISNDVPFWSEIKKVRGIPKKNTV